MVLDPDTLQPLERDQALFYFWQVLKGVNFLHSSNILHLDIKGTNILVFDEGRTLKICDLGTALHVDDIASSVGKNLGTIQFSAPEVSIYGGLQTENLFLVKGLHTENLFLVKGLQD